MIRGFEEQFEESTVDNIRDLLSRIESLSLPSGASRYYAVDLSLCLQAGALLGALQVGTGLLEIFVREFVIERASEIYPEREKVVGALQANLEQMKNVSFKKLVEELSNSGIWVKSEAELAKQFYDDVRIPLQHGLPARFVSNTTNYNSIMDELFGYTQQVRNRDIESSIEENALILIDIVIGLIERNYR